MISIRTRVLMFFIVLLTLLAVLMGALWMMLSNAEQSSAIRTRQLDSIRLAEELRHSSDDLTRMARTYVVTGDERFKDYFNLITRIRDGQEPRPENYQNVFWDFVTADHRYAPSLNDPVSIIQLMAHLKFSQAELAKLQNAKSLSDHLIALEEQAFNAMHGFFTDPDGNYSVKGEPNQQLAIELLHGQKYHVAKANIMSAINDFFVLLEQRLETEIHAVNEARYLLSRISVVLAMTIIGFSVFGYFYFYRSIMVPLGDMSDWVHRIERSDYNFDEVVNRDDEFGQLERSFLIMAERIKNTMESLHDAMKIDHLTNIPNRKALEEQLEHQQYQFERYQTNCSLIIMDIDHFKHINDQHGHLVGDEVLKGIANILKQKVRFSDFVGRWGGEEFLIICPNTSLSEGKLVAEIFRSQISEYEFPAVGTITSSFGVSDLATTQRIQECIQAADECLYQAKQQGRNRVC